jgi:hypothetical protein
VADHPHLAGDGQSWDPGLRNAVLAPQDCLDCDPVQEMWRRATEKIERQLFLENGN